MKFPAKSRKILADPEAEVCYSVSFVLRIAVVCNSPDMVANEGVDDVICDLEAKLTDVIRYCHSVGRRVIVPVNLLFIYKVV